MSGPVAPSLVVPNDDDQLNDLIHKVMTGFLPSPISPDSMSSSGGVPQAPINCMFFLVLIEGNG